MSIHVKTATGLVEIGGKVTKEKVVSALGYEPANKTVENQLNEHENNKTVHISQAEREQWNSNTNNLNAHAANNNNHISQDERVKWNNKSDFTGDYNDLVNAPDITEDDSNNLLVSDTKGNIIMRVDANGITTTEVSADKIITSNIEYNKSKIEIIDKYDNILLRVDESGLTTTDINAKKLTLNGNDVGSRLDSLDSHVNQHTASINSINSFNQQIENTLTNHKNDTNIHITANERKTWNDDISKNKQDISSLNNNINQHIANTSNPHSVTKAQLGLGNVDNTSDINKPVSEAQQMALNALKDELTTEIVSNSDSFVITDKDGRINFKVDVNGVETTDLNAKNDISIAGSSLTNTINTLTANINSLDNDVNVRINSAISAEESRSNQALATHEAKKIHITEQERTKWDAADTRSSTTESNLNSHTSNQTNPHNVTKSQVGLGNVDNTSDIDKPVSTQQQTALNNLKTELSESIVSESGEWIIVDKNDRINTKVDSNGLSSHTINATEDILLKSESLTSKFNTINNSLNLINSELDTVPNQISSAITNANLNQYAKQTSLDATNQKVGELEENLATKATISDLNSHTSNTNIHVTVQDKTSWDAKATTEYVDNKVAGIVNSAPETLDTLNELAKALGNDENFSTTVTTEIGKKLDIDTFNQHTADWDSHVTQVDRTVWNNKSDFTGDYNDLINAPNIEDSTEDGVLNIVDTEGRIIVKVDENGLTTKVLSAELINFGQSNQNLEAKLNDDNAAVNGKIDLNSALIDELTITSTANQEAIVDIHANISNLQTLIESKPDKQEIEWASYDDANASLTLQVPNTAYKLTLSNSELKLAQGDNFAQFKDNTLTSEKISATTSLSIGGLTFVDEGNNGFSIM